MQERLQKPDPTSDDPNRAEPAPAHAVELVEHDGTVHGEIEALLHQEPFRGRALLGAVHVQRMDVAPSVIAAVPACNEARRIVATLDSLAVSLTRTDEPWAIVVLANNSQDATVSLAQDWGKRSDAPLMIAEALFTRHAANAGHARRLALDIAHAGARPDAVLLSTDADTLVGPEWASRLVARIRCGASVVAGWIETDADEFAALPAHVRRAERTERALFGAQWALWRALVPDAPPAFAIRAGGASLALDRRAYERVGRLPTVAVGEDRAMIAAMLREDERVEMAFDAPISTSCRLEGRVEYGMSGMLRARLREADPSCDELLLPANDFVLRTLAWRLLRDARCGWARAALMRDAEAVAAALGLSATDLFPHRSTHGRDWERVEALLPAPERLRVSQARVEKERARLLLNRIAGREGDGEAIIAEVRSC